MENKKYPLIFIVGPTATGKTDVAVALAQKISAEIISCDSMLVYKQPRILVNKPDREVLTKLKHHMVDVVSVEDEFDVYRFKKDVDAILDKVYPEKNLIFVGGSGLYVKVLLDGIFEGAGSSDQLRKKLGSQAEEEGVKVLYNRLKEVDPQAAAKISPKDLRRIIRGLEVYYLTAKPISQRQKEVEGYGDRLPIKMFGLSLDRNILYQRIDKRAEAMFDKGAIQEIKEINKLRLSKTAKKILGVPQITAFLSDKISKDEALEELKTNTRRFAKRQLTWFRKDKRIEWIDVEGKDPEEIAEELLNKLTICKAGYG